MKKYIKSAIGNINHEDYLTRFEIAKSPDTDIDTLMELALDDSPLVRFGVYNNPNITSEIRMMTVKSRFSINHAEYQIYCRGDIADKEKISNIVENAIEDIAICTCTPYVIAPTIAAAKDTLSIAGSFDTVNDGDYDYETVGYIREALEDNGYHVINAYLG